MNRWFLISLCSGLLLLQACSDKEAENDTTQTIAPLKVSAIDEVFNNPDGTPGGTWYARMLTIDGPIPNKIFNKRLTNYAAMVRKYNIINKQFMDEIDPEAKKKLGNQLKNGGKAIMKIKREMTETYGVTLDRRFGGKPPFPPPYLVVIERSKLLRYRNDAIAPVKDFTTAPAEIPIGIPDAETPKTSEETLAEDPAPAEEDPAPTEDAAPTEDTGKSQPE